MQFSQFLDNFWAILPIFNANLAIFGQIINKMDQSVAFANQNYEKMAGNSCTMVYFYKKLSKNGLFSKNFASN